MQQSTASQMLVKARCSVRSDHFAIVFTRTAGGYWEAQNTLRISDAQAARGYQPGVLTGVYIAPTYRGCPYCSNGNFFRCNACGILNCQGSATANGDRIRVFCAECKGEGFLEGRIEKIEAFGDL